jgi:endonuclease YncB( thermonuclease family)
MYQYKISKILRVLDGDTVDVTIDLGFNIHLNHRVRLVNIDAPSVRTLNEEVKKYGLRAKEKLEEYLNSGDSIIVATQKPSETEKYGRVLGEIYVEGHNLTASEYLFANQYVWVYDEKNRKSDLSELALLNE